MMPAVILMIWAATGIAAAACLRSGAPHPMAWTPIAAILGPLWIAVAVEQRSAPQLDMAIIPADGPRRAERCDNCR